MPSGEQWYSSTRDTYGDRCLLGFHLVNGGTATPRMLMLTGVCGDGTAAPGIFMVTGVCCDASR